MKLLKFLARERAVIAGVVVAIVDAAVELAKYDHLTWRVALPVIGGFVTRWFVTPTSKEVAQ